MFVHDALSGRTVAFSSSRSKRPHRPSTCPFCKGCEALTPPATLVLPGADWRVRVFSNAFPVVSGKQGRHEVIVETPRHSELFEDFSERQLALLFEAFQTRFVALSRPASARYVLLFKNFGDKSGASIPHEHSQIVSFPFVPDTVKTEWKNEKALDADGALPALLENPFFKAVCPTASHFPYQVRVLAKNKTARFDDFSLEEGVALLSLLQAVIRKVKAVQGAPDYTLAFHAAPKGRSARFFVDVFPRKAVWGGFELGSGVWVNFKEPEAALKELKKA
ncbi:DUF4931 domain-containing protein [Candidatus Micrarchaeota archaeon]|nr:DUF4931 domain-containing protein [Candidatus Micrarchaeota archaeon]